MSGFLKIPFSPAGIELNHQMLPVFLGLLFAAAAAWLYLSRRLYAELMNKHPDLYEKLGSPRFLMNRGFSSNFKVLAFIFRNSNDTRIDASIQRLCQGLRALFYVYAVCLAGAVVLLLGGQ